MSLWTVFAGFCLLVALALVSFYVWYLFWPVVPGRVLEIREGVTPKNGVRGPRKYRVVVYAYTAKGKASRSTRQGLILSGAAGPGVGVGGDIKVSVCPGIPGLSCPRRPIFEGGVVIIVAGLCAFAGLFVFLMESVAV